MSRPKPNRSLIATLKSPSGGRLLPTHIGRRILLSLTLFRLFVSVFLVATLFTKEWMNYFNVLNPSLARAAALIYLGLVISYLIRWYRHNEAPQRIAVHAMLSDLILGTLLLHSLDGISSGLGVLLVFGAATASLYLPARQALFFASLVTLAIIGETLLAILIHQDTVRDLAQAGFYGVASFFGALAVMALMEWSREYEKLAKRQSLDLANLEQINELIIRRMRMGVLVLDAESRIRVMNESAWYLLGSPLEQEPLLASLAPDLNFKLEEWAGGAGNEGEAIRIRPGRANIIPSFIKLPGQSGADVLIFLENTETVARRANEMTITSLAKLSAGIAHEIRNPLTAVSHAAQLLRETEDRSASEQRLLDIINSHCQRMNDIVNNILQLSRREHSRPEIIHIIPWIRQLVKEFRESSLGQNLRLVLDLPPGSPTVLFDRSQLHQVMWKLLENAATHAVREDHPANAIIRLNLSTTTQRCIIELEDDGPGISETVLEQLFEPFVSTHKHGSGLGLYIAKQLCEANLSQLIAESSQGEGSIFKIHIPLKSADTIVSQEQGTDSGAAS